MKKLIITLCVATLISCSNKSKDQNGEIGSDDVSVSESANGKTGADQPLMKFEEEVFDFGKIIQGEKVTHAFTFTNIGKKNLIISSANGSCGCTVPEWPKEPIKPGATDKVNVVFNSEGKRGIQEKTVTIVTNCEPATLVIRIKAEVIVAETAK